MDVYSIGLNLFGPSYAVEQVASFDKGIRLYGPSFERPLVDLSG
mgnify:CR=1 FL=1